MAAKRRAPVPVVDLEDLVAAARAAIEQSGAVKLTALGPASARPAVADRLVALGFERTAKLVRRPLQNQIVEALSHGASVPVRALKNHVVGATKAELERSVKQLVSDGSVSLVLRGKEPTLVAKATAVISSDALRRLQAELKIITKSVADALKKPNVGLLQSDVSATLERVQALAAPRKADTAQVNKTNAETVMTQLLRAVDAARDEQLGMSFVPSVVRSLGSELDVDAAKAALVQAASSGLLELRPEGGLGRLSAEELELCPPGPQGTRLSWAKRNQGAAP